MEEKKLTAEEIVKKLNYIKEQYLSYIYNDDDECKVLFVDDILDLIHRLQSENKELKSPKFASWKLKFFNLKEEFDKELSEHEEFTKKAKEEIERLTEERDMYADDLYWKAEVRKREDFITELTVENAELQKQVDELKDICLDCPYKLKFDEIEKQTVKDTAKEILQRGKYCMPSGLRDWIKERYGVEVE